MKIFLVGYPGVGPNEIKLLRAFRSPEDRQKWIEKAQRWYAEIFGVELLESNRIGYRLYEVDLV